MLGRLALAVLPAALAVAALNAALRPGVRTEARPAAGFAETVVLRGLTEPMAVAFARDGRVFVAEKRGVVKVFDGLGNRRPAVFADLRERVYSLGDHGIFGLALDARDRVYVLYTFDGPVGARRARWHDTCPGGANSGRCPVSGRVSLLSPDGSERVLLEGWCQQYASHGVGALAFGPDGSLYASGGEGASYERVDTGEPGNVCGDPAGEGGALRAQDARTSEDPLGTSGSVIRIDPATGHYRQVAYGLRNPFRFAVHPGTEELWIGDVGSTRADELDLARPGRASNFGWPCFEGDRPLRSYDEADVPICERLYREQSVAPPFLVLPRERHVVEDDPCEPGTQAVSGLAFYKGGTYPSRYRGALFLSDYSRSCIWALLQGADGRPDRRRIELFRANVANPVYLTTGPGGDLFYVDFGGALRRIRYVGARAAASARAASPAPARRTTGSDPVKSTTVDGVPGS